jgi:hypothetical protein
MCVVKDAHTDDNSHLSLSLCLALSLSLATEVVIR